MGRAKLTISAQQLEAFCRRHHIRKLALFGSVLRDDFGPDSDVDVLVEFEPGHVPGLTLSRLPCPLFGIDIAVVTFDKC